MVLPIGLSENVVEAVIHQVTYSSEYNEPFLFILYKGTFIDEGSKFK